MQRTLIAATLAASLVSSGAASANASAKIMFGDPAFQTIETASSGANADGLLLTLSLGAFATRTVDVPYTVVLSADGLPASRQWTYCSPTFPVHYCGPAPTGSELAEAAIFLTFSTETGQDGFIGYTGSDPAIFDLSSGTATYHGTMSFTVTELRGDEPHEALVFVQGNVFVDAASAVPEPATLGLLLAGFATVALKRRAGGAARRAPSLASAHWVAPRLQCPACALGKPERAGQVRDRCPEEPGNGFSAWPSPPTSAWRRTRAALPWDRNIRPPRCPSC